MHCIKYLFQVLILFTLCSQLNAQIPVIKEPRHKLVLENEYVRLLDVHLKPGDTTLYHIHAAPSVIVILSNSIMDAQLKGEEPAPPTNVLPGQTTFMPYGEHPITHRVFNSGNNVFHVMDIELARQTPSPDSCNALQQSNVQTTINEKLVRVYKFDLNSSASLNIAKSSCAHLLICISGEVNATGKKIETGKYIFFNPDTAISINNQQKNISTCVLLELK